MSKYLLMVILLAEVFWLPCFGADKEHMLAPLEVINKDGQLTISDGSSVYIFKKDGSFSSQPVGLSGRTIEGKWHSPYEKHPEEDSVQFMIEGKWNWMNGISSVDDFRTMTMSIWTGEQTEERGQKIYKGYFVIDELKKKT